MAHVKGHSPVGASSRYRWKNCQGSVNFCKKLPPAPPSSYAAEGTKAHEVAAFYLEHQRWPDDADTEMIDHLTVYTDSVLEDWATVDASVKGNLLLIEHDFELPQLHPDARGTADAVIYDAKRKILYVHDLKYGAGVFVEAEDNDQLIYYAVGAFLSLDLPAEKVVVKIAQPRYDHAGDLVREQTFASTKLLEHAWMIEEEIKATDDPNAPLNPGKEWCRFCPGAGVCPALHKKALAVAADVFTPKVGYDPELLAQTLDKLPMLEAFASQVREFAYNEAIKGRVPPKYKLVKKRAVRSFKEGAGIGKFLSKVCNSDQLKDCYTEPKLKTPAQIEKVVNKKHHEKLGEFVDSESSGLKLVHETEKGEAILLDAANVFKDSVETDSLFNQ